VGYVTDSLEEVRYQRPRAAWPAAQFYRLNEGTTIAIGRRTDADITVPASSISRKHCRLDIRDGVVWFEDVGSLNGSLVDSERIQGQGRLWRPGTRVSLAGVQAQLDLLASPPLALEDWQTCTDFRLLQCLPSRGSNRKLRLLARALLFGQKATQRPEVALAEAYADGEVEWGAVEAYRRRIIRTSTDSFAGPPAMIAGEWWPHQAELWAVETLLLPLTQELAAHLLLCLNADSALSRLTEVCDLIRDALGDFFFRPTVPPEWRIWGDHVIERIAQSVYDERRFDEMPILADALEDAGCEDRDLLDHCRNGKLHARGCWALDAILQKGSFAPAPEPRGGD
jgi:FHA domain-containing protein